MAKGVRKSLRLSAELDAAINVARGDVSWSRWVERALERALEGDRVSDVSAEMYASPALEAQLREPSAPVRASRRPASPLADRQAALNKAKGL